MQKWPMTKVIKWLLSREMVQSKPKLVQKIWVIMESNLKHYGDMISKTTLQMKKNLYDVCY
jgi:hypothetical protein